MILHKRLRCEWRVKKKERGRVLFHNP
uniref:Uncharacterized protein n=1 Tax=Arundo donax TaxID=35708 RepID=A0A0A9AAV8_ARUDO